VFDELEQLDERIITALDALVLIGCYKDARLGKRANTESRIPSPGCIASGRETFYEMRVRRKKLPMSSAF
jgi:hypothetical protein